MNGFNGFPRLFLLWVTAYPILVVIPLSAVAQPITADGTTPTEIIQTGNQIDISGGTIAGTNQFHSFDQFNVPGGQTANFEAPQPIQNVLGRVTGGDPSVINGTVKVSGSDANLYLMNPSGMVFGKDAKLDVNGSFNATSATGIGFEGGEFNATGNNDYNQLVNSPNRYNFDRSTGDVVNHGNLAVPQGKNINLVGDTVENTGNLSAPGGGVNIIAVPGDKNRVRIQQAGMVLELDVAPGSDPLTSRNLPRYLTGGSADPTLSLEVGADGVVRLTRHPKGTAAVSGTAENPVQITGDLIRVMGEQVIVDHANLNAAQEVLLRSSQGTTSIRNTQASLHDVVGVGGLLQVLGRNVEVQNSNLWVRSPQGVIRLESQSPVTIASPTGVPLSAVLETIGNTTVSNTELTVIGGGGQSDRLAGRVEVLGSGQVALVASLVQGSEVYIGGDFQGRGELITARETIVDGASTINASGVPLDASGLPGLPDSPLPPLALAGRVIVWADDKTRFLGRLRNAAGFAEISGKQELDLGTDWDQRIQVGELLLDPNNITIQAGTAGAIGSSPTGTTPLGATTISNFLQNTGNLILTTSLGTGGAGNITLNAAISWTSDNDLTLTADRSIILNANSSITATSGDINLNANLDGAITSGSQGILLNGGDLSTTSGTINLKGIGGSAGTGGGAGNHGIAQRNGSLVTTVTGDINYNGRSGVASVADNDGIRIFEGSTIRTQDGNINLTGVTIANGAANDGVLINDASTIRATGTGSITLDGTSTWTNGDRPILSLNNSTIAVATGNITITGRTPNPNFIGIRLSETTLGSATANNISLLTDTLSVAATIPQGIGKLTIAPITPGANFAASFSIVSPRFSSVTLGSIEAGNVTLSGTTTLNAPTTILGGTIDFSADLITTGNVTLEASRNIALNSGSSIISGSGDISLRANGIQLTTGTIGSATGTGAITFNTDTLTLTNSTIQGTGILTIAPITASTSIGLGDNVPGTLNLTATGINGITPTFNSINIGRSDGTGSVRVGININTALQPLIQLLGGSDLGGGDNANLWTVTGLSTGKINGIAFQNFTTLLGGGLTDTLEGTGNDDEFLITAADQVTVGNLTFTSLETLDGGTGNDTFRLGAGTLSGSISGGAGTDTFIGNTTGSLFTITAANGGTIAGISGGFTNIENLIGGTGNDRFGFGINGTLSGSLEGGDGVDAIEGSTGNDTFILSAIANSGTALGTAFTNIETIDAGAGNDTVSDANNIGATFQLTGVNNGFLETLSNLNFTNVETVLGSATAANTLEGTPGNETFILSGNNSFQTGDMAFSGIDNLAGKGGLDILQGTAGNDRFVLTGVDRGTALGIVFSAIESLDGSGGQDTLQGSDLANSFTVTGANAGGMTNLTTGFSNLENLIGGAGNDTFTLAGGSLEGTIDGGTGTNSLIGDNIASDFVVTGNDRGTVTRVSGGFSNIENLTGGTANDSFTLNGGTVTGTIAGGSGTDSFTANNTATAFILTGENQGTVTGVTGGFSTIENLTGGTANDRFTLNGGTVTGTIAGGSGTDSFTANNTATAFVLTGENQGTVTGVTEGFSTIENLTGGTGDDSFTLNGGTVTGTIAGGSGTDSFTANNTATAFILTGENQGTVTGITGGFSTIENLTGGTANDSFTLNGGTVTGTIAGGSGTDTFTADNLATNVLVTGNNQGTATGIGVGFSDIENITGGTGNDRLAFQNTGSLTGVLDGGAGNDTLVGDDNGNLIDISGTDSGTFAGKVSGWRNIENVIGGTGTDTFLLSAQTLTGSLDGGGGNDSITADNVANTFTIVEQNGGTVTGVLGTFSNIENLTGNSNIDTFIVASGGGLDGILDGAGNLDIILADDGGNTFLITGENSGVLIDRIGGFINIENLTGGTGSDTFTFEASGNLTGLVDGNSSNDYLRGLNTVTNFNIEGDTLTVIIDLDGADAPASGLYDIFPGDGAARVFEVSGIDQTQILAYEPASSTVNPSLASSQNPLGNNGIKPENTDQTNITPENPANVARNTNSDRSSQQSEGASPSGNAARSVASSNTNPGDSSDSFGGNPTGNSATNSNSNNDSNRPDPTVVQQSSQKKPDPNAPKKSKKDLPNPNTSGSSSSNGGESIASGSGLSTELSDELSPSRELPLTLTVLGIIAAAGGVAVAIATGAASAALQGTSSAAQKALQGLQNLGSKGGLGFPLAAAAGAIAASQAQQQLAQMKVALEPRLETQLNLRVNKEEGASLTQTAIDLANKTEWDETPLGDYLTGILSNLSEFFGFETEESDQVKEVEEVEKTEKRSHEQTVENILENNTLQENTSKETPNPQETMNLGGSTDTDKVTAIKAKIAEAVEKAGIPPAAVELLYTVAIEKITAILEEIEVFPDILGTVWGKSLDLIEYRNLLANAAPGESVMIPLVNHEVLVDHTPSIDLKFKDVTVGTFEIPITFGMVVDAVMLAIEDRKIKKIQIGSTTGVGSVEFAGLPLYEVPEKTIDFNKKIDLGEGIEIGGSSS